MLIFKFYLKNKNRQILELREYCFVFYLNISSWSYIIVRLFVRLDTGCPNKHGNSVTNSISSLLRNSIVIPNFKNHNNARVYFMKTVNGCKEVYKQ